MNRTDSDKLGEAEQHFKQAKMLISGDGKSVDLEMMRLACDSIGEGVAILIDIRKGHDVTDAQSATIREIIKEKLSEMESINLIIDEETARMSGGSSDSGSGTSSVGKKSDTRNYYVDPFPTSSTSSSSSVTGGRKSLGGTGPASKVGKKSPDSSLKKVGGLTPSPSSSASTGSSSSSSASASVPVPEPVLNELEKQIESEMLDRSPGVCWKDIAGLKLAKDTIQEAVILPTLRPDIFTGLRAPPKGVLLYGPPGTGKTMIAKATASESGFSFFCISASTVTSKWVGEGEKLVKALFTVARYKQPALIFMDEIDSILSARREGEHDASRRLKTEFMIQIDGAATVSDENRLLILGATNVPWELDEAVLRRFVKRIYVPLPDEEARMALIEHQMKKQGGGPNKSQLSRIVKLTAGYSGSDLNALCKESAMGPVRELGTAALRIIKAEDLRQVNEQDFKNSLKIIRPSVSSAKLNEYVAWSDNFGAK